MTLELGRLVGRVPAMIVVMGIFDKIREALDSWVEGLGEKFSDAMGRFASWGISTTLDFYTNKLLPDASVFETGGLSKVFGSFNSLSIKILTIFVLISMLATIVAVARQKRAELAGRTTASLIRFTVFVFTFFPAYILLLTLVATLGREYLKLTAGISPGNGDDIKDQIIRIMVPDNLLMQALTGLLNGIIMLVLIIEGFILLVVGMLAAITHGFSTAIRAAGDAGLNQYKFSVATLWTVPLSILAITILLGLDILILKMTNEDFWPSVSGVSGFFGSLAFGALMIGMPLLIGYLVFNKVTRSVTSGENRIQNAIDIATMPEVEARQIDGASRRQQESIVTQFARELPVAIASGENGPDTEAKELVKQIAIQRAMASANPVIAGGMMAYTGYKTIKSVKDAISDKGGDAK